MVGLDVWFENPEPLDAVDLALDISDQLQMLPQSSLPQFQQMINDLEERAMNLNGDQNFQSDCYGSNLLGNGLCTGKISIVLLH